MCQRFTPVVPHTRLDVSTAILSHVCFLYISKQNTKKEINVFEVSKSIHYWTTLCSLYFTWKQPLTFSPYAFIMGFPWTGQLQIFTNSEHLCSTEYSHFHAVWLIEVTIAYNKSCKYLPIVSICGRPWLSDALSSNFPMFSWCSTEYSHFHAVWLIEVTIAYNKSCKYLPIVSICGRPWLSDALSSNFPMFSWCTLPFEARYVVFVVHSKLKYIMCMGYKAMLLMLLRYTVSFVFFLNEEADKTTVCFIVNVKILTLVNYIKQEFYMISEIHEITGISSMG